MWEQLELPLDIEQDWVIAEDIRFQGGKNVVTKHRVRRRYLDQQ